MKKFILFGAMVILAGCTQYTPSMMSVSPVELAQETSVEQIPLDQLSQAHLKMLATHHRQYGTGPLDLTVTYDPSSKDFTAMRAVHELGAIKKTLSHQGVRDMRTVTLPVEGGSPSLLVSYHMVRAQAPTDCDPMPGLENNLTTRHIGDYKFGCGVESMLARQIARPKDLEGNAILDPRDARRESIVVEDYSAGVPREPLEGIERDDLVSGGG